MKVIKKNIAVFDDDHSIRELLDIYFREKGYGVATFATCDNIIEQLLEFDPDLVIMDYWIPPGGGLDAVKALKANDELSDTPVILFSANRGVKDVSKASGADAYLEKPFDLEDLDKLTSRFI